MSEKIVNRKSLHSQFESLRTIGRSNPLTDIVSNYIDGSGIEPTVLATTSIRDTFAQFASIIHSSKEVALLTLYHSPRAFMVSTEIDEISEALKRKDVVETSLRFAVSDAGKYLSELTRMVFYGRVPALVFRGDSPVALLVSASPEFN